MSDSIRIQCINKSDRQNVHERITHIGGVNPNGTRWKLPSAEAILAIEQGKYSFYVVGQSGHRVTVIVSTSRYGHKYLKTTADDEQPNNLLSLPECP